MKTVLITGAAGNLGSAAVDQFLEDGYKVVAIVSPGKEDQIKKENVDVIGINLADEKEVEQASEKLLGKYPDLDAALFIAGGYHYGGLADTDGQTIQKMFTVNFKTAYFLAKKIFLHLKEYGNGGRFVFVGAKPVLEPKAGKDSFAYALSKSLIFELSDLLNAEGAKHNIISTVVVPSIIDTPPNREAMPDANFDQWVKPAEIAKIMAFACSEDTSSVREPVIKVYGQS